MESVYRHFPKGRLATLAILGNHDYGPEWSTLKSRLRWLTLSLSSASPCSATKFTKSTASRGRTGRLVGESIPYPRGKAYLEVNSAGSGAESQSRHRGSACLGRYEGWILPATRTGGQCKPPFLPPPLLPCRNPRYTAGEFDLSGGRRMYISRGIGHLLNVRFNVRPEVTIFELRSA